MKEYFYKLFLSIVWWLFEEVGFSFGVASWNKFIIAKWRSVEFFLSLPLSLSLSLSHTHSLSITHTLMWSNMEVIYDAFEKPVLISPPGPIKVCPTPPAPKVPSPRKLLILQIPPAQKLVRRESIREKKKVKQLCLDPKKRRYWAKFSWEN